MKLEATKIGDDSTAFVKEYTIKDGPELLDHYAGHALSGMVSAGYPKDSIVDEAFQLAERMLAARGEYL